jgi:hypothetical protein
MSNSIRMHTSRPTPTEVADLKRLAAGIIRAQGNRFVKTLLRSKNIQVGANKDEFQTNLTVAIESGELTLIAWYSKVLKNTKLAAVMPVRGRDKKRSVLG